MNKRIKVVWICHFSNLEIKKHIVLDEFYYVKFLNRVKRRTVNPWNDMAVWITNAIKEFEKFDDIDLTIIFPYKGIKGTKQHFTVSGINYYCFRSQDDNLLSYVRNVIKNRWNNHYHKNRKIIKEIINTVSPDIVHIIGAENPYYSLAALDVPKNIVSIVSLQTLMSSPNFLTNYSIDRKEYLYRTKIESLVINNCKYVATTAKTYRDLVKENINNEALFLDMKLAVGQKVDTSYEKKDYDFVYFAANISKAADYAIEAFAIAHQQCPFLTLNISGFYSHETKSVLDNRIRELKLQEYIFFTGAKQTHDDVLNQIKKSKYAVLPLKVDMISGTIREAIACGLPVVTTITPSTPLLNENRESVLLSPSGDFKSMAEQMIRLVKDVEFSEMLKNNATKTIQERYSNLVYMEEWRKAYFDCLDSNN